MSFKAFLVLFVTNLSIFPFNLAISFTRSDDMTWLSGSDIKNTVSILLFNCLFIPANWNSSSKSETALKPLNIIVALCFEHRDVVRLENDSTFNLWVLSFKSLKSDFFTIETLSSPENKYSYE